ncbi:MOSC domain-containing protein [Treponema sp. J25]|nr:MOSC domain-containing protein [Treponema sp. J25]
MVSINVSPATGVRKTPVERAEFLPGFGLAGDAHGGLKEDRQVSLLAWEDIQQANQALLTYEQRGLSCTKAAEHRNEGTVQDSAWPSSPEDFSLMPGDFAENLTTEGVALTELPLGSHLVIGPVVLEVSKIGKECHAACEIRRLVGDCIMPRRGIFARVINGGVIHRDDMGAYYF